MSVTIPHFSPVEDFVDRWERGEVTEELLGQEIRSLRRRLRVTVKSLAVRAELTMATLSNLERGTRPPRSDTIDKIIAALKAIEKEKREALLK